MHTETKQNERADVVVIKALILEKHLKKGAQPADNVVRGWYKQGDRDPVELNDDNRPPIAFFLAGPLKDVKKLEAREVDCKLGKVKCDGLTGSGGFKERADGLMKVVYDEIRLHDKSPFGVTMMRCDFSQERDGEVRTRGTMTLTLTNLGKTATSELPDHN